MKNIINGFKKTYLRLGVLITLALIQVNSYANNYGSLPQLPSEDLIGNNQGIIDVFIKWISKVGKPGILVAGVLIMVTIASGIVDSYKQAEEKDAMGKFWPVLFAGMAAAAFALTILYAAWGMVSKS